MPHWPPTIRVRTILAYVLLALPCQGSVWFESRKGREGSSCKSVGTKSTLSLPVPRGVRSSMMSQNLTNCKISTCFISFLMNGLAFPEHPGFTHWPKLWLLLIYRETWNTYMNSYHIIWLSMSLIYIVYFIMPGVSIYKSRVWIASGFGPCWVFSQ